MQSLRHLVTVSFSPVQSLAQVVCVYAILTEIYICSITDIKHFLFIDITHYIYIYNLRLNSVEEMSQ